MRGSTTHGTRAHYQKAGCHCDLCRAGEARYRANLRTVHRAGKVPLGAVVKAQDAARLVRALLIERYTRRQLAEQAGLERHRLTLTPGTAVRLRTVLSIRRAHRLLMVEPE